MHKANEKFWCMIQILPLKTAQPAAAASDMLWPANPGKKEPPITAIGVNLYNCLNSPTIQNNNMKQILPRKYK